MKLCMLKLNTFTLPCTSFKREAHWFLKWYIELSNNEVVSSSSVKCEDRWPHTFQFFTWILENHLGRDGHQSSDNRLDLDWFQSRSIPNGLNCIFVNLFMLLCLACNTAPKLRIKYLTYYWNKRSVQMEVHTMDWWLQMWVRIKKMARNQMLTTERWHQLPTATHEPSLWYLEFQPWTFQFRIILFCLTNY